MQMLVQRQLRLHRARVENDVSVVPCRYAAFIAAQLSGNQNTFSPSDFQAGDDNRMFSVHALKADD